MPQAWTPLLTILFGGLTSALVSYYLQSRRAKQELALRMIEGFSTLEAHDLRREFWKMRERLSTVWAIEDIEYELDSRNRELGVSRVTASLAEEMDTKQHRALLFVLSFFVLSGSLMRRRLINRTVFFDGAERWMLEIFDAHLLRMSRASRAGYYAPHRAALEELDRWWRRWERFKGAPWWQKPFLR